MAADPVLSDGVEVYDLKGLTCPLPVMKAAKRLRGMAPGQRLWLETSDPLAAIDIPAFCSQQGHALLDTIRRPAGHGFLVERGRQSRSA